jgi:hypothetical protein
MIFSILTWITMRASLSDRFGDPLTVYRFEFVEFFF